MKRPRSQRTRTRLGKPESGLAGASQRDPASPHIDIYIHARLVNLTGAVSETIDFFDALMYKPGVVSTRR